MFDMQKVQRSVTGIQLKSSQVEADVKTVAEVLDGCCQSKKAPLTLMGPTQY